MSINYRVCTKCGKEFPATSEFFHKMKAGKFGLKAICKSCSGEYHKENKERFAIYNAKYQKNNKEKCLATKKKWQKNNREGFAVRVKKWRKNNFEKIAIYNAKYRENNQEKIMVYRKNNRDKHNTANAKRRARKRSQTPYLTEVEYQQIKLIYQKSQDLGPDWQVDHIRPLVKGGLHHPANLQIVTKKYNLQKHDILFFRLPNNNEVFKSNSSIN